PAHPGGRSRRRNRCPRAGRRAPARARSASRAPFRRCRKSSARLTCTHPFWHGKPVPKPPRYCPLCASPLAPRDEEEKSRLACTSETCDYVFYDNPVPVVAALLEHGETVLLVRNKGWPEKWYGLVSGFLEKGESPEEGVLREVKEEVGLKGEIVSFIGAYAFH